MKTLDRMECPVGKKVQEMASENLGWAERPAFAPEEMVSLLEAMARKADRHETNNYTEIASIARHGATAIRSLTEERDRLRASRDNVRGVADEFRRERDEALNDKAALTARVGELEAALLEISKARIPTQKEVVYLDRSERAEATVDWMQKRAAAVSGNEQLVGQTQK